MKSLGCKAKKYSGVNRHETYSGLFISSCNHLADITVVCRRRIRLQSPVVCGERKPELARRPILCACDGKALFDDEVLVLHVARV